MKWCSLPYEDATWELKEDVDEGKVEEFKKIQNRQPRVKRVVSSLLKMYLTINIFRVFFLFTQNRHIALRGNFCIIQNDKILLKKEI